MSATTALLEGAFSVGSIATALLLGFRSSFRRVYRNYALALATLGGLMCLLTRIATPWLLVPPIVVMGSAVAALRALSHVLFQQSVPNAYKGRFFGILETLAAAVTPLGYAAVGLASQGAGVQRVLMSSGVGLVLLACVVAFMPRVAVASAHA